MRFASFLLQLLLSQELFSRLSFSFRILLQDEFFWTVGIPAFPFSLCIDSHTVVNSRRNSTYDATSYFLPCAVHRHFTFCSGCTRSRTRSCYGTLAQLFGNHWGSQFLLHILPANASVRPDGNRIWAIHSGRRSTSTLRMRGNLTCSPVLFVPPIPNARSVHKSNFLSYLNKHRTFIYSDRKPTNMFL